MNINKMTRKQFAEMPVLTDKIDKDFDSIVILPYNRNDDSGFSVYSIVICDGVEPLGRLLGYDTFSLYDVADRLGIDVLAKSKLTRIFFERGKFIINSDLHNMERKGVK